MAAKAGAKADGPRIALDQVLEGFASGPAKSDAVRAEGLAVLTQVKRAKLVQARRERARVAVRHGEASAQVARLDRQLAMEHGWLVGLRAEGDRARTPAPARDLGAWQIHGYLRSQDGLPRAGYQVGLFRDATGKREPLATTETDASGYFLLRLESKSEFTPRDTLRRDLSEEERKKLAAAGREQDEQLFVAALKSAVVLGVAAPGQTGLVMDDRTFHPRPGAIAYRDLTVANPKDDGQACQLKTRLLGNSGSRELHNLDNEKPQCQIAEIRPDQRFYFQSEEQARKLGYDFCAFCFGKARSRR